MSGSNLNSKGISVSPSSVMIHKQRRRRKRKREREEEKGVEVIWSKVGRYRSVPLLEQHSSSIIRIAVIKIIIIPFSNRIIIITINIVG